MSKSNKTSLLFFVILFNITINAQWLTSAKKDSIIACLDSLSYSIRYQAVGTIERFKIVEALPKIESTIFKQECSLMDNYLSVLAVLNSADLYSITKACFDSADFCDDIGLPSRKQLKLTASNILINHFNDFSTTYYVFEAMREFFHEPSARRLLNTIARSSSEYADSAKHYMYKIIRDRTDRLSFGIGRYEILNNMFELYHEEIIPDVVQIIKSDPYDANRYLALDILCKLDYIGLNSIIKERIQNEEIAAYRYVLVDSLLSRFASPSDVFFVNNYLRNETDDENISLVNWLLEKYQVPKFLDGRNIIVVLDSLNSFTNQSYDYYWLKEESFKNELISILQTAKNYLIASDSINCAKQIKFFQTNIQQVYSDSAGSFPKYVSREAYKFLYYYPQYILERLPSLPTVKLKDSQGNLLPGGSLQYYEGGWKNAVDNGDGTFTVDTKLKNVSLRMTYEYGSQTKSNVPVGSDTVTFRTVNALVKLQDSNGNSIDTGKVQYYAGGWRNFGSIINGTASKELLAANYTFRLSYAFASNDKAQNLDTNVTVIFKTINANVELRNSINNLISDNAAVQYYSGGWRDFSSTTNGVASKELLPNNYTFRMSYGFASNDKTQNIGANPTVVFQTVNTNVELRNSLGELIDQGVVQYYSGGWREFGSATNGVASRELLPNNYTFRLSYGFASNDKAQNIGTNPTVIFQTVNTNVELRNSLGELIDQGVVQYYSGGWRGFGSATNGVASKELLPNNYTFRMSYGFASNDKAQNIGANSTVIFQTVNTNVELRNSLGELIDQGVVQYYSGGWRSFGSTSNGITSKELLPNNYTFRITHEFISNDKAQNNGTNNTVTFSTVLCSITARNSQNQPLDNVRASYYSGGWRQIGQTSNGIITKELLPSNLTFRINYGTIQQDKVQNLSTNTNVEFIINSGE